ARGTASLPRREQSHNRAVRRGRDVRETPRGVGPLRRAGERDAVDRPGAPPPATRADGAQPLHVDPLLRARPRSRALRRDRRPAPAGHHSVSAEPIHLLQRLGGVLTMTTIAMLRIDSPRARRTRIGALLAGALLLGACDMDIANTNAPTIDDLVDSPTRDILATAATGIFARAFNDV